MSVSEGNGSLHEAFAAIDHERAERQEFEDFVRAEFRHMREQSKRHGETLDLILAALKLYEQEDDANE